MYLTRMDIVQLVKRAQSGDREAFGLLYNLYAPSMMKVIKACVHNHDIAQDILHDGFIIAISALDKLIEPIKFESWLTTVMRNLSLQYLREASKNITVPMTDTSGESLYERIPLLIIPYHGMNLIILSTNCLMDTARCLDSLY